LRANREGMGNPRGKKKWFDLLPRREKEERKKGKKSVFLGGVKGKGVVSNVLREGEGKGGRRRLLYFNKEKEVLGGGKERERMYHDFQEEKRPVRRGKWEKGTSPSMPCRREKGGKESTTSPFHTKRRGGS